jgi:hypothetical protein
MAPVKTPSSSTSAVSQTLDPYSRVPASLCQEVDHLLSKIRPELDKSFEQSYEKFMTMTEREAETNMTFADTGAYREAEEGPDEHLERRLFATHA